MDLTVIIPIIVMGLVAYITKPKDNTLEAAWEDVVKYEQTTWLTTSYHPKYHIRDLIFLKLGTICYNRMGSWYSGECKFIGIFNHWFNCGIHPILGWT